MSDENTIDDDIDAIISGITPAQASTDLCLRGDLLSEADRLNEQLNEFEGWEPSSLSDVDPRTPIRARLNELREEMRASTKTFEFQTLGDREGSDLMAAHPPTKDDKGEDEGAWNAQTYPVALVAASAIRPTMTVKQAEKLFDKLNLAQRSQLFMAAYRANNRQVDIPFFAAGSAPADSTE